MRRLKSSSNRGLSLAETMLVMTLVMVLMGLMAGLVKEYSEILRTGRSQTARLELLQNVLTRMAGEVNEASQITVSEEGPFQTLKLRRLNPDSIRQAQRLSEARLDDKNWSPFHDTDMISVEYKREDNGRITRTFNNETLEIARDVSALKMEKPDELTLLIKLATAQGRTVKTLSTRVDLFAVRQP